MVERTISSITSRCRLWRWRINSNYYYLRAHVNREARGGGSPRASRSPSVVNASILHRNAFMTSTTPGAIVAFIEDLMFLSPIREAAQAAGLPFHAVRNPAMLVETCGRNRVAIVFVDLDSTR